MPEVENQEELCSGLMRLGVPSIEGFDVGVVKGSRQEGSDIQNGISRCDRGS